MGSRGIEENINIIIKKLNEDTIKIIKLVIIPVTLLIIEFIAKLNFEIYYKIPAEYAGNTVYLNWRYCISVCMLMSIYLYMFYLKNKTNIKFKQDLVAYIFMSILIGIDTGMILYLILGTVLNNYFAIMINSFKPIIYWIICVVIIVLEIGSFNLLLTTNKRLKKRTIKYIIVKMLLLLFFIIIYGLGLSNKKNYELLKYQDQIKVVLSKRNNKLVIADAIINEGENTLVINTKNYGEIEKNNLFFEYRVFDKVEIKK
ncbi:hypothetical protein [Fusobacterium sp.]|uniref:hypothetical protein n=1 Tax=Fusobacterium sp. TaxID=68766 RepID=UPI00260712C9|nr:hypothetical protein [Fusobacterium sp.]